MKHLKNFLLLKERCYTAFKACVDRSYKNLILNSGKATAEFPLKISSVNVTLL